MSMLSTFLSRPYEPRVQEGIHLSAGGFTFNSYDPRGTYIELNVYYMTPRGEYMGLNVHGIHKYICNRVDLIVKRPHV
jgi:hypothetical protein